MLPFGNPILLRCVWGCDPMKYAVCGKKLQPSKRRGHSIRTLSLIRQVVQKMFNCPNHRLHGLDAQALIWKLRTAEVQPSGCSA
jgi:hypothetical protein